MTGSQRSERARLKANLKKLHELKAADLVRNDLQARNLTFSNGRSYFERTLGLFRGLGHSTFARVPSAHLKTVADHAERALAQFEEILRFTGEGLPNPGEVRNHLIGEVRDYYRELHDDIAVLVARPHGQHENPTRAPWYSGAPLAILMLTMLGVGVAAAYHYGLLGLAAQDIMDSLNDIVPR